MLKLTEKQKESIRQLEWLGSKFDAIANDVDTESAYKRLLIQQANAVEWLDRLGVAALRYRRNLEDGDQDARLTAHEVSVAWVTFLENLRLSFPEFAPTHPSGTVGVAAESGEAQIEIDPELPKFYAMCQGDACRWIAWLIREGHTAKVKQASQESRPSKNERVVNLKKSFPHLTNKQIGKKLGMSEAAVQKAIHRAR